MHFFPYVCNFLSIYLNKLMHIWLMSVPHQMIIPFTMFKDRKELEHFPRGIKRFNYTKKILNLVKRDNMRYSGWKILWSTNKVIVLYQYVWKYFYYPEEIEMKRES